jgi:hypothetical protein
LIRLRSGQMIADSNTANSRTLAATASSRVRAPVSQIGGRYV